MTRWLRPSWLALGAAFAAAVTGLSACSSDDRKGPTLGSIAVDMARARLNRGDVEEAEKPKAPQVTRAQLEAFGRPVIFASVPRFGTGVAAIEVAQNREFKTYMGADKATVTLENGIVTGTRGLFVDLIAQEISIPHGDMFQGEFPKTYQRVQRHLTGEGTLGTQEFVCAIVPNEADEELVLFEKPHQVRQFTELCRNKTRAFKNSYWVERPAGTVWQSHQSVSKETGHIIIQRVVR